VEADCATLERRIQHDPEKPDGECVMPGQPSALADFVPDGNNDYEVFVARPEAIVASASGIDAMFGATNIDFSSGIVGEVEEDTVVLFNDGEVVTTSPSREFTYLIDQLTPIGEQIGDVALETLSLPSVLVALANESIRVDSFSTGHQDLLFRIVCRCIEAQSWNQRHGQLRVGVQYLSRLTDTEGSTMCTVAEQLAETNVQVHMYGILDTNSSLSFNLTVHGGWTDDFARNWFVIYQSPSLATTAAFIANELERGGWRGTWTFDADQVKQVTNYLKENL
jgi:hypothetical protein